MASKDLEYAIFRRDTQVVTRVTPQEALEILANSAIVNLTERPFRSYINARIATIAARRVEELLASLERFAVQEGRTMLALEELDFIVQTKEKRFELANLKADKAIIKERVEIAEYQVKLQQLKGGQRSRAEEKYEEGIVDIDLEDERESRRIDRYIRDDVSKARNERNKVQDTFTTRPPATSSQNWINPNYGSLGPLN